MRAADERVSGTDLKLQPKPHVLIVLGHYLPSERGGGPIRSIANLVEALGDEFDFRIVTLNRDLGASTTYANIQTCVWCETGKARVWYVASGLRGTVAMVRLLLETKADVIYLNSYFSFLFSILPVAVLSLMPMAVRPAAVLAPRGEFSLGALRFKAVKKFVFLTVARWSGLYRQDAIVFQASSPAEAEDINRELAGPVIEIAHDVSPHTPNPSSVGEDANGTRAKVKGCLDVVWVSRIVRKKNLDGALSCLSGVHGDVRFTVYGPTQDRKYWNECKRLMGGLPKNIQAEYGGELPFDKVVATLATHQVFLFPTHGENYGYVICEALTAGCPVVISDQTPWRALAGAGVGWDISLDDHEGFVGALQQCVDMGPDMFDAFSRRARAYAAVHRSDPAPVEEHRRLFRAAVTSRMNRNRLKGAHAA